MSYTVLARRYRSASFDEVVGQEAIAKTLVNAIATGRVAHAYLFTGTRGVGKTSMARILARGLNAPDTIKDCPKQKGAEYPPKAVQERMAEAIMRGEDLNVIEIDGASNRGVDEARQLIANAGLTPTANALYKVYIIDEVHMLTREAFNALLKTMEEPPSHVKFILCTTEPHKVPETIQSRCQRFDFRNIATARIADHLQAVLSKEKIKADKDAVWEVARLANGSMRDGLSLLDRLIAACGDGKLTADVLQQVLGLPPREMVIALVDALAACDVAGSLKGAADLLTTGISQDQLVDILIDRLRQMMLIAACGAESELIELSQEAKKSAADQAARFDAAGLVHMIALCENLQRHGKSSANPRALLDATIVRLALAEKMADVTALLSGQAAAPRAAASAPDEKKNALAGDAPSRTAPPRTSPPPPLADKSRSGKPDLSEGPDPNRHQRPSASGPSERSGFQAPARGAPVSPLDAWNAVLAAANQRAALSWVQSFRLHRFEGNTAFVDTLPGRRQLARFLAEPSRRDQLASLLGEAMGRPVKLELVPARDDAMLGDDSDTRDEHEASDDDTHAPPAPLTRAASGKSVGNSGGNSGGQSGGAISRQQAMSLPLVRRIIETFDATLLDVRAEGKDEV